MKDSGDGALLHGCFPLHHLAGGAPGRRKPKSRPPYTGSSLPLGFLINFTEGECGEFSHTHTIESHEHT